MKQRVENSLIGILSVTGIFMGIGMVLACLVGFTAMEVDRSFFSGAGSEMLYGMAQRGFYSPEAAESMEYAMGETAIAMEALSIPNLPKPPQAPIPPKPPQPPVPPKAFGAESHAELIEARFEAWAEELERQAEEYERQTEAWAEELERQAEEWEEKMERESERFAERIERGAERLVARWER